MDTVIRTAMSSDIDAIMRIQELSYGPDMLESATLFGEIIRQNMSLVADSQKNGVIAFALVHPVSPADIPKLNGDVTFSKPNVDMVAFIHDLSVHPDHRKTGIGKRLVKTFRTDIRVTRFATQAIIVAVNGAEPFWRVCGFQDMRETLPADVIASYGGKCTLMDMWL
jgi:predicted N-acetyltransferase YhbS